MTGRILSYRNRLIISLLILLGFSATLFSFQSKVNGVINKYGRVTGIGVDFVIVNDFAQFSQFAPGDTVLLIQMRGGQATVPENASYGSLQNYVGSPGKYQFLIILSVNAGLKKIVFRNDLLPANPFDITGDVQIIKTPSYNSVVVDSDLSCLQWDSVNKIGGVLSMVVGKTIKLDANIDVTGKGFLGGGTVIGDGICVNSNFALYNKYSFPQTSTNSGFKGESLISVGWVDFSTQYPIFPAYSKGMGANFTGGGGGNGNTSGGGGGANYGSGGKGGRENNSCLPIFAPVDGGVGGRQIKFTPLAGGIFSGAGGGSSSYIAGATPSPGGNGGGIIVILCDTIIGNGKIIRADGAGAPGAGGNSGAGGGGGGGSVALYLGGFSTSNLTISANGGKGGDNIGQLFGEGGGGGGGYVWINNITIPGNVTRTINGGALGTRLGGSTGSPGALGESLTNFVAVLNGFLFNSIRSSVTGDQVDSICSNMMPHKITGTRPVGGSGTYSYLWEKSYDEITWTPLVNDADPTNYTPTVIEINTVFFRRTITDTSVPALVDVSKPVKIIVQPFIKNNIIGTSDTICIAQNPPSFSSLALLLDGNGKYTFKWKVSLDNSVFNLPVNTYNTEGYTPPPALLATSWYKRIVTSGRCMDSSTFVKITVLPNIANNNILSAPQEICYGMLFTDLAATTPSTTPALAGGDNSYRFKWESSVNGSTWVTATGISNLTGYNPNELSPSFPGIEYYRRNVYSGIHDVCINTSASVLLKDFPVLTNNTISANQTIGHDSIPAALIGLIPSNGSGSYLFLWQYKTKILPWTAASGTNNTANYLPAALTDTTWYRRVVNSSACSDTSNVIVVNVHKTIINNTISFISGAVEDTICNGSTPVILNGSVPAGGSAIPGDYTFQWYFSINNTIWSPVASGGTTKDYQPGSLLVTTWFRRNVSSPVVSPKSTSKSNSIKITVLPLITNKDISADQMICKGSPLPAITNASGSPLGGDGIYRYTWRQDSASTGWTNIPGYIKTSAASYSRTSIKDTFRYKRYIYSGIHDVCSDSSNFVTVGINQLPTGSITTVTDTTVCGGLPVPVKIHMTGTSKWRLIYAENGVQTIINKIQSADTTLQINRTPSVALSTYLLKIDSLKDGNNCVALPATLTGSRKIDVNKVPKAEAGIPADSVCGPEYNLAAIPSVGSGTWTWTKINITVTPGSASFTPNINNPNARVLVDSLTTEWKTRYKFIWKEVNWLCTDKDSVQITFDKRTTLITGLKMKELFSLDKWDTLKVAKPLVGTGVWSVITGGSTILNDTIVKDLAVGLNIFEWKVTNGKCESQGLDTINVAEVKIPEGFSPNGDTKNDEFEIKGFDPTYCEATLRILNSAGTEVFYTTNSENKTWSNFKGENSRNETLPEGTYYYLLTIKSKRSSTVNSWSGFIILKRI
jgi:gliding motility-associated-like protein